MVYTGKKLNILWDDLTDTERKAYVNQDYVYRKELLVSNIENHPFISPWGNNKSDKTLIYEMYFLDKQSVLNIQHHIKLSKRQIFRIIEDMKESIEDFCSTSVQKEILTLHFVDGIDPLIIEEKIGVNNPYIYRIINSYLKHCKKDKRKKSDTCK